jgi:hypothetical protein
VRIPAAPLEEQAGASGVTFEVTEQIVPGVPSPGLAPALSPGLVQPPALVRWSIHRRSLAVGFQVLALPSRSLIAPSLRAAGTKSILRGQPPAILHACGGSLHGLLHEHVAVHYV